MYYKRHIKGIGMLSHQIILIVLAIQIRANNCTHSTFYDASAYCSQYGGLAYNSIVTASLLTDYKVDDCILANKLELNDGEAVWVNLKAEIGHYITEYGCASVLPKDFILNLAGNPSLFHCTKECLARGSQNYIAFYNDQCFCMADDYSDMECSVSTLIVVYRKVQFDVKHGNHRCIVAELKNSEINYTSRKCSHKHRGICVDHSSKSKLQSDCKKKYNTTSEIGRNFCIPPKIFTKDEIKTRCSKYKGKLTPHIYQGISHYLDDGLYFQDSFLTFDPKSPGENSEPESVCLSITNQGCTLILETDKCDKLNRYLCETDIQNYPTGAANRMVSNTLYYILLCYLLLKMQSEQCTQCQVAK